MKPHRFIFSGSSAGLPARQAAPAAVKAVALSSVAVIAALCSTPRARAAASGKGRSRAGAAPPDASERIARSEIDRPPRGAAGPFGGRPAARRTLDLRDLARAGRDGL